MRLSFPPWVLALALVAPACAPPPAPTAAPPADQPSAAPPATTAPPTFVNRVWEVADGSAVAPGQLYVFLSEGTLVVASPTGTPSLGRWSRRGDGLTMVEAGLTYATDIVALSADEFRIRSHNPGTALDIRLVPATGEARGAAR
jgi:hypothetical protein